MRTGLCVAWAAVVGGLVCGCEPRDLSGPPEIHYGRDECAQCGMILSDERFAAAMLVRDGGGGRYLLFDDIGDMLEYGRGHPEVAAAERFVHDFSTGAWVSAGEARYVVSESVHTPMGSGILAYAGAGTAGGAGGGRVMTLDELAAGAGGASGGAPERR